MPGDPTRGATAPAAHGDRQAATWVQQMFSDIAPKYDQLNHLLSFNIDRSWRKVLTRRLSSVLQRADAIVVDLCCGTGDVTLDLQSVAKATVMGVDFCHPMLIAARDKTAGRGYPVRVFEGDALDLPLADASADALSIAFGFRNLADYEGALQEFRRVLKPGGALVILEFSHPPGRLMRMAYGAYSRLALPMLGALISGSREAYAYLPDSIERFPKADELERMMAAAGFEQAQFELLTGGVAALHIGLSAQQR